MGQEIKTTEELFGQSGQTRTTEELFGKKSARKYTVDKAPEGSFLKDMVSGVLRDLKPDLKPALGMVEGAGSAVTGMVGFPVGTVAGVASLPFVGPEKAREIQGKVSGAVTYQPRTEFGKTTAEVLMSPFAVLDKGLEKVVEGIAPESPQYQSLLRMAADAGLLMYGGKAGKRAKELGTLLKDNMKRPEAFRSTQEVFMPEAPPEVSPPIVPSEATAQVGPPAPKPAQNTVSTLSGAIGEMTRKAEPVESPLPVDVPQVASEMGVSKLARRVESEAVAKELTDKFGGLPEYAKMNMKEQADAAFSLIDADPVRADRILSGQEPPPPGVRVAALYVAKKSRVIEAGSVDDILNLAHTEHGATVASRYGQEVKAADILRFTDDPVEAIREVELARVEKSEKATGRKPDAKVTQEMDALKAKLDEANKRIEELASLKRLESAVKPKAHSKFAYGSQNKVVTQVAYEASRAALREFFSAQANAIPIDPAAMGHLVKIGSYHLEAGSRSMAAWTAKMVAEFGERVKPYLKDVWKQAQDTIQTGTKETLKKGIVDSLSDITGKIEKAVDKGRDLPQMGVYVNKLARHFVESGTSDLPTLVSEVHKVLVDILPDITPRETMDAISQYGKFKRLSQDEISVTLRDLKGQAQQVSKLEDLQGKGIAQKTGIERRKPSDAERALIVKVNEAKKKFGIEVTDPETQLTSSLDTLKTRLRNETKKYEDMLRSGEYEQRGKTKGPTDPESARMQSDRDRIKYAYDVVKQRSGKVTPEEAASIVSLSKEVANKKAALDAGGDRIEYGASRVAYLKYVESLKKGKETARDIFKGANRSLNRTFKENPAKAVGRVAGALAKSIADVSVSMVASIDNSFIGRQGLNTLMTHPSIWLDMAKKSFVDIYKTLKQKHGGEMAQDALMADVYSRPNFLNGEYTAAKLIPEFEEQFPTMMPERIPVIGRIFKASAVAFEDSAIRARTAVYDLLREQAVKNGVAVDKVMVKDLGKLVNSLTARGDLGKFGQGGVIRLVMWAPKMLKGNIDVLTAHGGGAGLATPFARKKAAMNLVKIVGETAAVMAVANAIKPGSVETDSRSADFGKIKIGNTRFDITGGKGSIITLVSRLLTGMTKSTATGLTTKINSGKFGSKTMFDVGIDFLANKMTPVAGAIRDVARGRDMRGEKPTPLSVFSNMTSPISIRNFTQLFYGPDQDGSAEAVVGAIVDLVGLNSNTYDSLRTYKKSAAPGQSAYNKMVEGRTAEEAMSLYPKAPPEERDGLKAVIIKKVTSAYKNADVPADRKRRLIEQYWKLFPRNPE